MRLAFLLLLLCFFRSVSAQPALPAELRVGMAFFAAQGKAPVPPVGRMQAFNEEQAREICRRLNVLCRFERMPFAEMLPAVEAGQLDLAFGFYLRTPEREQRVAFSDSIGNSSSRLLGTVEGNRRLASRFGQTIQLDRLRDVRLAAIAGSQQATHIEALPAAQRLKLIQARSMAEALALLREGKVDLCLVPMLFAFDSLQNQEVGRFEFVGPAMMDGGLGGSVHILLPKNRDPLRLALNQALAAMRADGSYHRLMRRHFPFNLD